jgi:hypothetical protein
MLRRNLLYTAATRARKLLVVVSTAKALHRAVNRAGDDLRNSRLVQRLRDPEYGTPPVVGGAGGDAIDEPLWSCASCGATERAKRLEQCSNCGAVEVEEVVAI